MGGDIGDVNLKRTVEEIKRLQEEASSLRQENIQLKVSVRDHTFEAKIEALPGGCRISACTLGWVYFDLGVPLSCQVLNSQSEQPRRNWCSNPENLKSAQPSRKNTQTIWNVHFACNFL